MRERERGGRKRGKKEEQMRSSNEERREWEEGGFLSVQPIHLRWLVSVTTATVIGNVTILIQC